jgi:cell pole-organizing protein PopZ
MNENNEDNDVPTGPSSNDLFEEMLRKAMEQEADKLKKEGKPVPHQPITTNDRVINDRPAKKAPPKRKLAPKTKDEDADVEDISDISSPPRKSISRRDDTPLIPVTIEMQNGEETGPSSNDLFEQKLQQALLESDPSANTAKTATPQTISARLASKNWAERSDAYVELRNLFATATSDDDSCFTEYRKLFYALLTI